MKVLGEEYEAGGARQEMQGKRLEKGSRYEAGGDREEVRGRKR